MYKIILVRHGESVYNQQNLFTGWTDVALSDRGIEEARIAGQLIKEAGYTFDLAFSSVLKRSIQTMHYILDELDLLWIPEQKSWKLNERHYGALQGLSKIDTAEKYGEEQLQLWRRSLTVRPPLLEKDDPRSPRHEVRYNEIPDDQIPYGESLKDTVERVGEFWHDCIVPLIQKKEHLLIAAHGNTLRALIKYLEDIDEKTLTELNIPTGIPLVYELDDDINPIRRFYLGEDEHIERKTNEVANEHNVNE
ncbi:2,3-diphosphoglycerate-dependent phosphoglycerate mutase [Paenibacillus sp. KACC 21273]|uniref:2,3-diphosphoglycerate-dependent phosphoglycerate mutase n=1 Tax=Paenibacillus sp. KACC 21273 TaxID=3025665 RepID=UPI002365BDE3|nr:2,3-diphosphoglycerate-dependent phosphoglycerate mutase [Paenibacillus sp. KACC 21273]WDF51223.1 2,3-diphosphoglycerate-dependent phosphoglycerate mutase [Paenibacillus sp. KACC 21273]